MNWLSNINARSAMVQPIQGGFSSGGSIFRGNATTVSPQTAMHLTTVFACTRVIAETISSISLDIYKRVDKGKEKATDHPLYDLLKYSPYPGVTSVMWRELIVIALNTRGNHYSQIIRNNNRYIKSIFPLVTDKMKPKQTESGKIIYEYNIGSKKVTLPSDQILHIPGLPSEDGYTGLSPIEYNRKSLELAATTQQFGHNFFDKGANASGAFTTEGELSDKAHERLKKDLNDNYSGMKNSGKPLLLEGGLKFERISIPNNDAQFLETRKYQKEEIASIFRVPMHMINSLENATFSNIEHQSLEFVQFTILPWLKRIEQALNTQLLSKEERKSYVIKFNVDSLLRGDFKTRTEGYKTLQEFGNLTINDVLRLENMNTIGAEGDKRFVPMNYTTLEKLGEENENNQD